MAPIALVFGVLLTGLGVVTFFLTGASHVTALIPAFLGIALLVLGLLSFKDRLRMHAMHVAALLGLLGFVGGAYMGFPKLVRMLGGAEVERPTAAVESSIMAVLCLAFVAMCVRSFIQARRRPKAEGGS